MTQGLPPVPAAIVQQADQQAAENIRKAQQEAAERERRAQLERELIAEQRRRMQETQQRR